MRGKARRALSVFLALTMVLMGIPGGRTPVGKAVAADGVTYAVDSSMGNVVDILDAYALIVFGRMQVEGHQHTNTLTNEFYGLEAAERDRFKNEFSVRSYINTEKNPHPNYIRRFVNMDQVHSTEQDQRLAIFGTGNEKLYIGESHTVGQQEHNHQMATTLDGHILRGSDEIEQDTANRKYIDLAKLQKNVGYYSSQLAEMENNGNVRTRYVLNDSYIRVNDTTGLAVVNVRANQLTALANTDMKVYFPSNSSSGLLINIDMAGSNSFTLKHDDIYIGNRKIELVEEIYNQNVNRIYWNFYDSSKTDGNYTGNIVIKENFVGTVIAPYANLESKGINGDIVVNNAKITGESHKVRHINNLPDPQPINTADFGIIKTYEGAELASMSASERNALLGGTEFTVYKQDGTTVAAGPKSLSWNSGSRRAEVLFEDLICGESEDVYYFKIKETKAPAGYKKNDVTVDCKVERDKKTGLLKAYYKRSTQSDSAYSENFPQFENIKKQEINPTLSMDGWTYGEDANDPVLSNNPSTGEVTYTYEKKNDDGSYTQVDAPVNAGEYRVTAHIAETDDYCEGTATATFTVEKAPNTAEITTTARVQRNVNGTSHTLDLSALVSNPIGTVTYSFVGNRRDCTLSSEGILKPSGQTGNVTIRVNVAGDENHLPTSELITVTITRNGTFETSVSLDDWAYGENPKDPVLGPNVSGGRTTIVYKRASDPDSRYSRNIPTEPGDYVVRYTIAAANGYESVSTTDTFTIHKAEPTVKVTQESWTYDEEPGQGRVSATGVLPPDTISIESVMYKRAEDGDDAYESAIPSDAGEYVVRVITKENDHYKSVTATTTFSIYKASVSPSVSLDDWTYGEEARRPFLTGNTGNGEVTYTYEKAIGNGQYEPVDKPLDAGEYRLTAHIAATNNYEEGTAQTEFEIHKADNAATVEETAQVVRDGRELQLSELVNSVVDDEEISYAIIDGDGTGSTLDSATGLFVSGPNTGTVIVEVTFGGNNNVNPVTKTITITVNDKKNFDFDVAQDGIVYGESLADPEITGLPEDVNAADAVIKYRDKNGQLSEDKPTEPGNYTVVVSFPENSEYNEAVSECDFTIEKAKVTPSVSQADAVFGDEIEDPELKNHPENAAITAVEYKRKGTDDSFTTEKPTEVGEYIVRVTYAETEHYKGGTATTEFEIAKAPITPSVTLDDWTYGESAKIAVVQGIPQDVEYGPLEYRLKSDADIDENYTTEIPTEAGEYVVRVVVPESEQYKGAVAKDDFTIKKAKSEILLVDDGESAEVVRDHEIDISQNVDPDSVDDDVKLEYSLAEEIPGVTIDPETGVVTVGNDVPVNTEITVVVKALDDPNHEESDPVEIKVKVIDKKENPTEVSADDKTYDGEPADVTTSNVPEGAETAVEYQKKNPQTGEYEKLPEGTQPTDAGDYKAVVTVSETKEFRGAEITKEFTIDKAENAATVEETAQVVRDGRELDLSELVNSVVDDEEISYAIIDGDGTGSTLDSATGLFVSGPNTGTVIVEVTFGGNNNVNPVTKTITITVNDKKNFDFDVAQDGIVYGESLADPEITGLPEDVNAADAVIKYRDKNGQLSEDKPTEPGNYTVVVSFPENSEYNEAVSECDFTIEKAKVTPSVSQADAVFGDEIEDPELKNHPENAAITAVEYKRKGTDDSFTTEKPTEVGEYIVRVTYAETEHYKGGTATTEFEIAKAPITPSVTLDDWTYGESAKIAVVQGIPQDVEYGPLEYRLKSDADIDENYTTEIPTEAGEYVVRVVVPESEQYKGAVAKDDFTIKKAKSEILLVDDGESAEVVRDHEIDISQNVDPDSVDDDVKLEYSLAEEIPGVTIDPETGVVTVGNDVPVNTEITVVVKALDDPNHEESDPVEIKVKVIDKKENPTEVSADDKTYDGEPADVTTSNVPEGAETAVEYQKKNPQTGEYEKLPEGTQPTDAGDYKVVVTVSETKEFRGAEITEEFTIDKAEDPAEVTNEASLTRDHSIDLTTLVSEAIGDVTFEVIDGVGELAEDGTTYNAGNQTETVRIRVVIADSDNYNGREEIITLTITDKKTIVDPAVEIEGWTYGEDANKPSLTEGSNPGNGAVTYRYKKAGADDSEYTTDPPSEAGDYFVQAVIDETKDYCGATVVKAFTIEKAENGLTVTTPEEEVVRGGTVSVADNVKDNDGAVTFSAETPVEGVTVAEDGTVTVSSDVAPGTVITIIAAAAGDDNHFASNPEEPKKITITVLDKEPNETTVSISDKTYDGQPAEPVITGVADGATPEAKYQKKDATGEYVDLPEGTTPKDAGDYRVIVTVPETDDVCGTEIAKEFTIGRAKATVRAKNASVPYGSNAPEYETEITGLVDGENPLSFTVACEDGEVSTLDVGEYVIKPTGDAVQGNYEVTYEPGTLTITKAEITPSVTQEGCEYGETLPTPVVSDNPGDGAIVKKEYKVQGAGDDTYTEEVPTDAGKYTVRVTVGETKNYKSGTATADFEITKAEDPAVISTDGKDNEVTVNTQPDDDHKIDLNQFVEGAEGDVTFTIDEDDSTAGGAMIDKKGNLVPGSEIGEVTVIVKIADSENHKGKEEKIVIKVTPKKDVEIKVTQEDITYGDTLPRPEISGTPEDVTPSEIVIEYRKKDGTEYTTTQPTDAGDYVVRVKIPETSEHAAASAETEFTIKKANDPAVIDVNGGTVKNNTSADDGHSVNLNDLVKDAIGDVAFAIDTKGSTAKDAQIDSDGFLIPGSQTGTVKVIVTVVDSKNHVGKTETITVTVTEKDTEELPVDQKGCTYGEDLPDPEFPQIENGKVTISYSGTLADGTDCILPPGEKPTEAGTYIVTVVCETADTVYTGKAEFTIAKAVPEIGNVTAKNVHNSKDPAKAEITRSNKTLPGKLSITEVELSEGTGTYHWTFVPEDTNNYEGLEGTVKITMTEHDWSDWEIVKEATETEEGLARRVCTICGETEEKVIPKLKKKTDPEEDPKGVYKPEGSDTKTYIKDSEEPVTVVIHRDQDDEKTPEMFDGVTSGGKALTEGEDYKVDAKGTITILPKFLDLLPPGEYSLAVQFKDGDPVRITVIVKEKTSPDSPKTGDVQILIWWMAFLSAATLFLVAKKRRDEQEEQATV